MMPITPAERQLRVFIVQMEINDLAAIAAIRERRRMKRRLAALVEVPLAARRARRNSTPKED